LVRIYTTANKWNYFASISDIGTASGQLIHHRQVWFTQKNIVLFSGAGSPVTKISWRGNIVAWADATQVRLMDITTQTAICYLNWYALSVYMIC